MASTSPMDLPRQRTDSVSASKRWPLHTSQSTFTSGRKFISTVRMPWPSQAGQRPPAVLKEKRPARLAADAGFGGAGEHAADRIPEAHVGGRAGARCLADGRLVHFEHALDAVRRHAARCTAAAWPPCPCRASARASSGCSTSSASVDLPEPETPVSAMSRPSGSSTSSLCRLCRRDAFELQHGRGVRAASHHGAARLAADAAWVRAGSGR